MDTGIVVTSASDYTKSLTADVPLPSGAVFTLRRPPLHIWQADGRIPNVYQKLVLEAQRAGLRIGQLSDAEERFKQMLEATLEAGRMIQDLPADEQRAYYKFEIEVVIASAVKPRIVRNNLTGAQTDAILLEDVRTEDFNYIFAYAMNNSPDVPVATDEGVTTVDAVARFRDGATGNGAADAGQARGKVRQAAKRAIRPKR